MKKLVVMDYSSSEIHVYKCDNSVEINDEYIENLGHHVSECAWMFGKGIDIINHVGTYC